MRRHRAGTADPAATRAAPAGRSPEFRPAALWRASIAVVDGIYFFNAANNVFTYAGANGGPVAATDGVWHSIGATFNGASSVIVLDGSSTTVNPSTTASNTAFSMADPAVSANLSGGIVEAGMWPSLFTGTNLTNLCHQQYVYWGLATSC